MNFIKQALKEDIGKKDITTDLIVARSTLARAEIIAKEKGIIAGINIAGQVFNELDKNILFKKKAKDGDFVKKGEVIAELYWRARAILTAERVALNFLQRLSGIATLTSKFVRLARGVKILDTRKTTPYLRELEKYAVRTGGGYNHRFNLNEAILIKDNHLIICGIRKAIEKARKSNKKIEVEVKNLEEVKEALKFGADVLLLDNIKINEIKKAVKLVRKKSKKTMIEVSGGVNLKNIRHIAKTGVDFISIGALTHSANALDISLEIVEVKK